MQPKVTALVGSLALACVLCSQGKADRQPVRSRYSLEEIDIVVQRAESGVKGVNAAGEVVGTLDTPEHLHAAFLYRKGKFSLLGTLGGQESWAAALNDKGQIVGVSQRADGVLVLFVWEHGRMREIKPLPTRWGVPATAVGPDTLTGLNNHGQVVGCLFGLDGIFAPLRLPLLPTPPSEKDAGRSLGFVPTGLNDKGQIIGYTPHGRTAPYSMAIVWDGQKQQSLGTLVPDGYSRSRAINNKGQVVGVASTEGIYKEHAFLWDGSSIHDLGSAGGRTSAAHAINDNGQIVGEADIAYEEHDGSNATYWGGSRAILWQDGKAYNLNDLIPTEAGWVLERAVGINARGQIVGMGYRSQDQGKSRIGGIKAFLLTPR